MPWNNTWNSEAMARKEREEMEPAMKEGYVANYDFIKESSNEWDFSNGDGMYDGDKKPG